MEYAFTQGNRQSPLYKILNAKLYTRHHLDRNGSYKNRSYRVQASEILFLRYEIEKDQERSRTGWQKRKSGVSKMDHFWEKFHGGGGVIFKKQLRIPGQFVRASW